MREDMHKVIVERPRLGDRSKGRPGREASRERLDPESAPKLEAMKRPHQRAKREKSLNENLNPLLHFLRKSVGRPWDIVHSEICARIRPTNAVQKHVLDHVHGMVDEHPLMIDGVPHYIVSYGLGSRPLHHGNLYVCPKTGLLRAAKRPPTKHPKHPPPRAVRLSEYLCAVLLKGCWHEAEMKRAPYGSFQTANGYPVEDAAIGQVYNADRLIAFWGGKAPQRAVSLRPMSRAEIRLLPI